jgi:hypothetical protein
MVDNGHAEGIRFIQINNYMNLLDLKAGVAGSAGELRQMVYVAIAMDLILTQGAHKLELLQAANLLSSQGENLSSAQVEVIKWALAVHDAQLHVVNFDQFAAAVDAVPQP